MAEKNSSNFVKEAIRLEDGRELIYYDFEEIKWTQQSSSEIRNKESKE